MADLSAFSLDGRRALVTGAGRGLGLGMAAGLVAAGARVALTSRSREELEAAVRELGPNAVAVPGDVSRTAQLGDFTDEVEEALGGGIDVVVHAAGVQHREPAEAFSLEEWERVISINLTAPFALSQEIGRRQLERSARGSHIFVGSLSSVLGLPSFVAYNASKSGVLGVIRALSAEWSGRGIRVNGIGPGYIRTKLTEAVFADPVRSAELAARIPIGRFGEPEDMAGAAVFLASDAAAYITGQLLMVDGGWSSS